MRSSGPASARRWRIKREKHRTKRRSCLSKNLGAIPYYQERQNWISRPLRTVLDSFRGLRRDAQAHLVDILVRVYWRAWTGGLAFSTRARKAFGTDLNPDGDWRKRSRPMNGRYLGVGMNKPNPRRAVLGILPTHRAAGDSAEGLRAEFSST